MTFLEKLLGGLAGGGGLAAAVLFFLYRWQRGRADGLETQLTLSQAQGHDLARQFQASEDARAQERTRAKLIAQRRLDEIVSLRRDLELDRCTPGSIAARVERMLNPDGIPD